MSERLALVTGTSSGIGAAVAKELLSHGWHVVGVARRVPKMGGERYRHLKLDLADVAAATRTIDVISRRARRDTAHSGGRRRTYPTPRTVWINRGSSGSTFFLR